MPVEDSDAANPAISDGLAVVRYRLSSLAYTRPQLANVFVWMLWGDLCLSVSEIAITRLVPLQLQALGASDAVVGLLIGSMFSLMNWVMNPLISTSSDRHRGRLGRRLPYLLYTAPFIAVCYAALGFSSSIAHRLATNAPGLAGVIGHTASRLLPGVAALPAQAALTIGCLSVLLFCFKLFDLFPQCIYYYLFADVIPQQVMGTFVCLLRVVATLGTVAFHSLMLPYAATHLRLICLICGLLYVFSFGMISLMVKEGEYPPPPAPSKGNIAAATYNWAREVFSRPFYWRYFLTYASFRWSYIPYNIFLIGYAQRQLHIDTKDFGHLMSIILTIQMPVFFLLGPFLDRYHPLRVGLVGFAGMLLAGMGGFVFIHSRASFFTYTIAAHIAIAIFYGALGAIGPRLLPRARYGQFAAATAIVSESGMLVLAGLCGKMLDRFGEQLLYLWFGSFAALGLVVLTSLYRAWCAHGGDAHYVAPGDFDASAPQGALAA